MIKYFCENTVQIEKNVLEYNQNRIINFKEGQSYGDKPKKGA